MNATKISRTTTLGHEVITATPYTRVIINESYHSVTPTELELELEHEHQEYEDLTAKYDLLEEDYLVIKAKLVMEKENVER